MLELPEGEDKYEFYMSLIQRNRARAEASRSASQDSDTSTVVAANLMSMHCSFSELPDDGYFTMEEKMEMSRLVCHERERGLKAAKQEGSTVRWRKSDNLLGSGKFGGVYEAMDEETGELIAVKEVITGTRYPNTNTENIKALQTELSKLRVLKHENIVRYKGMTVLKDRLCILMELCPGGSLLTVLKNFGRFEDPVVRKYTSQILAGIAYLHRHNIVHRNIKCANCLLAVDGVVRIADFGASNYLNDLLGNIEQYSTPHVAPEIRAGHRVGRQADVWGVGMCVVEMLSTDAVPLDGQGGGGTRTYPTSCSRWHSWSDSSKTKKDWDCEDTPATNIFLKKPHDTGKDEFSRCSSEGANPDCTWKAVDWMQAVPPPNAGSDARSFILACFTYDVEDRPTAHSLQIHPFVRDAYHKELNLHHHQTDFIQRACSTPMGRAMSRGEGARGELVRCSSAPMIDPALRGTKGSNPRDLERMQRHGSWHPTNNRMVTAPIQEGDGDGDEGEYVCHHGEDETLWWRDGDNHPGFRKLVPRCGDEEGNQSLTSSNMSHRGTKQGSFGRLWMDEISTDEDGNQSWSRRSVAANHALKELEEVSDDSDRLWLCRVAPDNFIMRLMPSWILKRPKFFSRKNWLLERFEDDEMEKQFMKYYEQYMFCTRLNLTALLMSVRLVLALCLHLFSVASGNWDYSSIVNLIGLLTIAVAAVLSVTYLGKNMQKVKFWMAVVSPITVGMSWGESNPTIIMRVCTHVSMGCSVLDPRQFVVISGSYITLKITNFAWDIKEYVKQLRSESFADWHNSWGLREMVMNKVAFAIVLLVMYVVGMHVVTMVARDARIYWWRKMKHKY